MSNSQSIFPKRTTVPIPDRFRCPLCCRDFSIRGFANHINHCCKKHNLTQADYERLHSTTLYSPVHQFAAKWFSLAKFNIHEFGLMNFANCYWYHVHADEERPCFQDRFGRRPETLPLLMYDKKQPRLRKAFQHFREHLNGGLTLGIWPDLDNRFTIIDLDGEQTARWKDLSERLIDLRLHFYIEFSGKKGLHFWIFWNEDLTNTELVDLHEYLCDFIPTDHKCWPFKKSLIKLPLGLHRSTHNLSCFLDYEGRPIPLENQFDYFLGMRTNDVPSEFINRNNEVLSLPPAPSQIATIPAKMPVEALEIDLRDTVNVPVEYPVIDVNPSSYDGCLRHGTKLACGRHLTLFHLAVHLKSNKRVDIQEANSILEDWSHRVPSKHPIQERLRDARSTVTRVYEQGIAPSPLVEIELSEDEIQVIKRVCVCVISVYGAVHSQLRKQDLSKRLKTTTKVALKMASLAKAKKGSLEINYSDLMARTQISKQALRRALDVLVEDQGLPNEDTDFDPVILNIDQRPKRTGGMFLCLRRGSFATRLNSVYQMKDTILGQLGWIESTVQDQP